MNGHGHGATRQMIDQDRIPDDAFVVRCGRPPFKGNPLSRACDQIEGVYGFSVKVEAGRTVEELAMTCRNNCVGYTKVEEIRKMGYEIKRTRGTQYHATVIVPADWASEDADALSNLFLPFQKPRQ
jgi:hypothetical protein